MKIEQYCIPNQVFRLEDGRAAKFFTLDDKTSDRYPITLIRDGALFKYDKQGRYMESQKHRLNVKDVMPKANWEVALGRCRIGQQLLMRDYSLAELADVKPGTIGPRYFVRHANSSMTEHNHNGWAVHVTCENDVVAYFDFQTGAPPAARVHVENVQAMVNRLRRSLSLPTKEQRKQEFDRVVVGMEHMLSKVHKEIT